MDFWRERPVAYGNEPDVYCGRARRTQHRRVLAADFFDIAGKELGSLVHGGVLVRAHDDLSNATLGGERNIPGRRCPGPYPRSADGAGPGAGLGTGGHYREAEDRANTAKSHRFLQADSSNSKQNRF